MVEYDRYIDKLNYFFKSKENKKLLDENNFDKLFDRWYDYGRERAEVLSQVFIDANIHFIPYLTEFKPSMFFTVKFKNKWVILNNNLKNIGDDAFNKSNLTNITIPNSVTYIAGGAFAHCPNLIHIVIPNSVKSIGSSIFWDCENLTDVIFEENSQLTSIGTYAFNNCVKLAKITIPDSVKHIGTEAFVHCPNLNHIEWKGKVYTSKSSFIKEFNKSK